MREYHSREDALGAYGRWRRSNSNGTGFVSGPRTGASGRPVWIVYVRNELGTERAL